MQHQHQVDESIDWLQEHLLGRIQSQYGYKHKDETHIQRHISHLMKVFSKILPGRLNHAEFIAALTSVNTFSPGGQKQVEDLFRRYDLDGSDHVVIDDFTSQLLSLAANPVKDKAAREAGKVVRSAIPQLHGLTGVTALLSSMHSLETSPGRTPVATARRALTSALPGVPNRHIELLIREAAKPGHFQAPDATVSSSGLATMLRGGLPRRRRFVIQQAWRRISSGRGAVPMATVLEAFQATVQLSARDFHAVMDGVLQLAHPGSVDSAGGLTEAGFVSLHRDMSALVGMDDAWDRLITDMWGAHSEWDERNHLLPFTAAETVRRVGGGGSRLVKDRGQDAAECGVMLAMNNSLLRATGQVAMETILGSPHKVDARVPSATFGIGARGPWPAHMADDVPPVGMILLRGIQQPSDRGGAAAAEYSKWRHKTTRWVGSIGGDTLNTGMSRRTFN